MQRGFVAEITLQLVIRSQANSQKLSCLFFFFHHNTDECTNSTTQEL